MRMLLPHALDDPHLHAAYADRWLAGGGVRANFVVSLDGAAALAGSSRGLQTPGDQRVFQILRDLADVVVVGRATAVAENYRALQPSVRRSRVRSEFGLEAELPIAVVTESLDLDPSSALFHRDSGQARTIVITGEGAGAERIAALGAVADVIVAGRGRVDLAAAIDQLRARGLTRILTEGGPNLLAGLLAAGRVDELCLTVVPLVVGPGPGRITGALPPTTAAAARLIGLCEQDGATFHRYLIGARAGEPSRAGPPTDRPRSR